MSRSLAGKPGDSALHVITNHVFSHCSACAQVLLLHAMGRVMVVLCCLMASREAWCK